MNIWTEGKESLTSFFSKASQPLHLHLAPLLPLIWNHPGPGAWPHHQNSHLCSRKADIVKESKLFIQRLQGRGYDTNKLSSLLQSAEANSEEYARRFFSGKDSTSKSKTNHNVYFHITFHLSHPNKEIKEAWCSIVATPPEKAPLNNFQTEAGFRIPVDRFVMCLHKPHYLGSLLSYRKLNKRQGPKVFSYIE